MRCVTLLLTLLVAASAAAQPPRQTQQDEYTRYELLAPETASFAIVYEVSATTPGATVWFNPIRKGSVASDESVIDMMTGQPLKFEQVSGTEARTSGLPDASVDTDYIRVHLARPIPGDGGQARVRVLKTYKDPRSYYRDGDAIVFTRGLGIRRNAVVLPAGYQLTECNVASQVLSLPDGRTQISFMHQAPGEAALQLKAKPGAQTGDAAKPHALTNARSWEPPPSQGPTERARLAERAHQDRDIVYFLQSPETSAFSLYHDYTESREGTDKYLNVVRTGSTVSNPSGRVLDTGEAMKVDVLTGAQMKAAGIETAGEQVAPDQQVVVFHFPAVKKGQSVRLRMSETYTAPKSYRLDGDELVFDRGFGRPRNSVVLPKGWYLTALSIPGIVRETPDGETRINFVNDRPDAIDVLIKARKASAPLSSQTGSSQASSSQLSSSQPGSSQAGSRQASEQSDASPVGAWRGESKCLLRPSGCNDEDSLYRFAAKEQQQNHVQLSASKIVNRKEVNMGTGDCAWDPQSRSLDCPLPNDSSIHFTINGRVMEGTMTLRDGTLWRKITLRRVEGN